MLSCAHACIQELAEQDTETTIDNVDIEPKPACVVPMQIHKLMAGLLDVHLFMGDDLALGMAEEEAAFFTRYIDNVIAVNGTAHWHQMLEDEFGGMNEVLFNLFDVTRNPEHLRCAP